MTEWMNIFVIHTSRCYVAVASIFNTRAKLCCILLHLWHCFGAGHYIVAAMLAIYRHLFRARNNPFQQYLTALVIWHWADYTVSPVSMMSSNKSETSNDDHITTKVQPKSRARIWRDILYIRCCVCRCTFARCITLVDLNAPIGIPHCLSRVLIILVVSQRHAN